jgi:hypothetical protein
VGLPGGPGKSSPGLFFLPAGAGFIFLFRAEDFEQGV